VTRSPCYWARAERDLWDEPADLLLDECYEIWSASCSTVAEPHPGGTPTHTGDTAHSITARLTSVCPCCPEPIEFGQTLMWMPTIGWLHESCA
jgi:hypothetical protein